MRLIFVVLLLIALNGCEVVKRYYNPDQAEQNAAQIAEIPETNQFDDMVSYASYLSVLNEVELDSECKKLQREIAAAPGDDAPQLHYAFLSMLTTECGNLTEARKIFINEINQTVDERLHRFLILQITIIDRMRENELRADQLDKKLKAAQSQEKKLQSDMATIIEEREMLRFKLDELKTIEQTLYRREEGRIQ